MCSLCAVPCAVPCALFPVLFPVRCSLCCSLCAVPCAIPCALFPVLFPVRCSLCCSLCAVPCALFPALFPSYKVFRNKINNINVLRSSYKESDIFVRCEPSLGFLDRFSWNLPVSNFTKIWPLGAMFMHAGRQTARQADMKKLMSAFPFLYARVYNTPDTELSNNITASSSSTSSGLPAGSIVRVLYHKL